MLKLPSSYTKRMAFCMGDSQSGTSFKCTRAYHTMSVREYLIVLLWAEHKQPHQCVIQENPYKSLDLCGSLACCPQTLSLHHIPSEWDYVARPAVLP